LIHFFKLLFVRLEIGQISLSLEAEGVELGGEGIEGAEGRDEKYQPIPYPPLSLKRTFGRDGRHPFLSQLRRPNLRPKPWEVEFRNLLH
jgi:hypothetical protein